MIRHQYTTMKLRVRCIGLAQWSSSFTQVTNARLKSDKEYKFCLFCYVPMVVCLVYET